MNSNFRDITITQALSDQIERGIPSHIHSSFDTEVQFEEGVEPKNLRLVAQRRTPEDTKEILGSYPFRAVLAVTGADPDGEDFSYEEVVACRVTLSIGVKHLLYLPPNASDEARIQAEALFKRPIKEEELADLHGWIGANTEDSAISSYLIDHAEIGFALGVTVNDTPVIIHPGGREIGATLKTVLEDQSAEAGHESPESVEVISVIRSTKLLPFREIENPGYHDIQEEEPDKEAAIRAHADSVILTLDSACGELKQKNFRLFSLDGLVPDFKIKIESKRIKIGCSWITIPWPYIYYQEYRYHVFAILAYPDDFVDSAIDIMKSCTIGAAWMGAVVGVVLLNPAAALAAFIAEFKRCVKQSLLECLDADLSIVRVGQGWNRL